MRCSAGAAFAVALGLCVLAPAAAQGQAQAPAPVVTQYTGTDENFPNPERGFNQAGTSPISQNQFNNWRNQGYTLIRYHVNLAPFRSAPLSDALLTQIATDFQRARNAGVKLIPRFAYDWTAGGVDAPVERVVSHIEQLAPVLRDGADVISYVEAGFIGAWGEWHGSSNNLIEDFETGDNFGREVNEKTRAIFFALLDALPPNRSVAVRTQRYKYQLFNTQANLTPEEAFSGSGRARTGIHNDCFLANETDWGTYESRETDLPWLAVESQYVPMGGETCAADELAAPFIACPAAVAEMELLHWTNLNIGWNPAVYRVWEDQGCMPEVRRRMGYRFRLTRSELLTPTIAAGGRLRLNLQIANDGFATPFNERPVELVLEDTDTGARHALSTNADPRRWTAGATTTVALDLAVPDDLPVGRYRLLLRLPDASPTLAARPQYAIRFANAGTWRADTGDNDLLTSVEVAPAEVGAESTAGGLVPATLSLELGSSAAFAPFIPGVAGSYQATTAATVISTAGDAALTVADPSPTSTGHLVNGAFALPQPLQAAASSPAGAGSAPAPVGGASDPTLLLTYDAPVSNDPVTVTFHQAIGAGDALRTGTYSKTLTFTLSTTSP